jgi:HAD superfamily hydrolase (TIGR01549 family)
VSGRRAARLARTLVMAAETPTNAAYGFLDRAGLDDEIAALRTLVGRLRQQRRHLRTRSPEAADSVPHDMVPDVKFMLDALAPHYPISVVSTGHAPRIDAFLAHHGVRAHVTAVVGAETTPRMKPHADPLLFAARAMGVAPEHCLMIGDTTVDMRTAQAAGAPAVGVLCGFGTRGELEREGAALILDTTSDLLPLLRPADDPLEGASAEPAGR